VGIPQCPTGFVATGENCVPASTATSAQSVQSQPSVVVPVAPQAPIVAPMQAPPPATAVVHFVGINDRQYNAQVTTHGLVLACNTPCTLTVPAGPAAVKVTEQTRSFAQPIDLPPGPSTLRVGVRRDTTFALTMIILGAIEDGFGVFMVLSPGLFGRDSSLGWVFIGASAVNYIIGAIGFGTAGQNRIEFSAGASPQLGLLDRVRVGAAPVAGGGAMGTVMLRF
jgi:hypothetical protein